MFRLEKKTAIDVYSKTFQFPFKVQELGLTVPYHHDDGHQKFIRQCLALPCLPADQIKNQLSRLRTNATTAALQELMVYIAGTWIYSETWPTTSWSGYNMAIRTNNDVEGWHNALNRRASRRCHLPLYILIDLLRNEASIARLQV